jgi:hypothetical protein
MENCKLLIPTSSVILNNYPVVVETRKKIFVPNASMKQLLQKVTDLVCIPLFFVMLFSHSFV